MPSVSARRLLVHVISRQCVWSGEKHWRTVCHWCSLRTNPGSRVQESTFSALKEIYSAQKRKGNCWLLLAAS